MTRPLPYLPRLRAAFRRAVLLTIIVMVAAFAGWPGLRDASAAGLSIAAGQREYMIKAAFIYEMIKATQWPKARASRLVICVLGRDPFGAAWESIVDKPVGDRQLQVTALQGPKGLGGCDVLFVGASERPRWSQIHADLAARPILTVSEMTGFSREGGMVTLMNVENRLRFDVNLRAVRDAGLSINTDALEQANAVHAGVLQVRGP
jgi:YfiR/HmsC-like